MSNVFFAIWNTTMFLATLVLMLYVRKRAQASELDMIRHAAAIDERLHNAALDAASLIALRREVGRLRILRDYLLRLDDPANAGLRRAASLESIINMARTTLLEDEADVGAD